MWKKKEKRKRGKEEKINGGGEEEEEEEEENVASRRDRHPERNATEKSQESGVSIFSRSLTPRRVISRPRKDPGAKAYNVALFSVLVRTEQTIPVVFNAKVSRFPLLLPRSTLHWTLFHSSDSANEDQKLLELTLFVW